MFGLEWLSGCMSTITVVEWTFVALWPVPQWNSCRLSFHSSSHLISKPIVTICQHLRVMESIDSVGEVPAPRETIQGCSALPTRSSQFENNIVAFIVLFAFTFTLIDRLVHDCYSNVVNGDNGIQPRDATSHIGLLHSHRKKREEWASLVNTTAHFSCLWKSSMLLHRQIHCSWYIKPRAITWCHPLL